MTTAAQPSGGSRSRKVLEITKEGTKLTKYFYNKAIEAKKRGDPVVWAYPYQPIEVFWAMDIVPVYPINYSAVIGAKQMSAYYLGLTEQRGYYQDLCRYCSRNIMGCIWDNNNETAPWGGPLANPTAIIGGICCDPLPQVWDLAGEFYKCPVFYYDRVWPADWRTMEQFPADKKGLWTEEKPMRTDRMMNYWLEMLHDMIMFLERVTGHKLEEAKLRHVMELSVKTCWYAVQIDRMRQVHPSPYGSTDHFPNFAAFDFFRGTPEGLNHMEKMYFEVKDRVAKGLGAVPQENYRLMWVGVPLWTSPGFYNLFEDKYGAVFVWEYPHFPAWMGYRDPANPYEEMARFAAFFGGEAGLPVQSFGSMFTPPARIPGHIDGAIIANMESCKAIASGLRHYEREFDKAGIPRLTVVMDPVDPRVWDEAKMTQQVSSFIETLKPRRPGK